MEWSCWYRHLQSLEMRPYKGKVPKYHCIGQKIMAHCFHKYCYSTTHWLLRWYQLFHFVFKPLNGELFVMQNWKSKLEITTHISQNKNREVHVYLQRYVTFMDLSSIYKSYNSPSLPKNYFKWNQTLFFIDAASQLRDL